MPNLFEMQGALASRRPWVAVGLIVLLTAGFSIGFFLDAGPTQDQAESFLPPESELAIAQEKIAEDFARQSTTLGVQVIVRGDAGDVLSPAGLQEVLDAFAAAQTHPDVAPRVVPGAFSPAHLLLMAIGADSYDDATQDDVDAALETFRPQVEGLLACGGPPCTSANTYAMLGVISLDGEADDEDEQQAVIDAQLGIEEALDDFDWDVVEARSFSGAKLNQESNEAQGTSTNVLMGAALLIILVLLFVFYRTGSDVALSIGGLVLTIMWVFGLQGLLGPGGVGLIGANSPFAIMIPILLIGLTVDYALQITGRYREHLSEGEGPRKGMFHAVRHSGLPLILAAATTAISFLTNVTSNLAPMRDFGIIAAIGVMLGWFVMITFVPAVRTILDRRRVRKGKRLQSTHMSDAIPGVGRLIAGLSGSVAKRPSLFLAVAAVVSVAAFVGAANVSSTFSETDFLPSGTESYEDLLFLDEEFAGGAATATLLIEGELDETETLRDLVNLELVLADEATRPDGMTGPVEKSFLSLAIDWAVDDGTPGDKYDPDVAPLLQDLDRFFPPADALHALFDKLESIDPIGFSEVVALHDDGPDRTIIVIPVATGAEATERLIEQLDKAWGGDPEDFYVTGAEVLNVAVNNELTDSQTQSVIITIGAALVLLMVFFGITEKRPALGVITVLPIGLVVAWVLGSMFVLDISYNIMTALITALTIGVGVDYTIHITHRFLEELREEKGILHAVRESMRTTGGALIGSALTTALGFGVLLFSPLAPMQQFGGLTALTILYSLIAAFLVLPPMLVLWALFQEWKDRQFIQDRLVAKGKIIPAPAPDVNLRCPRCRTVQGVQRGAPRVTCNRCGLAGDNPMAA